MSKFRKINNTDQDGNIIGKAYAMEAIIESISEDWLENTSTGKRYKRAIVKVPNPSTGEEITVGAVLAEANVDLDVDGNLVKDGKVLCTARPGKDNDGNTRVYFQISHLTYLESADVADFFTAEEIEAPVAQPKVNTPG